MAQFCPLIRKDCIKHRCSWYVHIQGKNPNTGLDMDKWACSIVITPLATIEASRNTINTTAAVDSLRNNVIKQGDTNRSFLAAVMQQPLIPPTVQDVTDVE